MKPSQRDRKELEAFRVISRLVVGPPRIEAKRVSASYTVHQGGQQESFDFIYRFEEPVFDEKDPSSVNLACMLSAQVALNYGLFCERIEFEGAFDRHDQRFLREMAENTAREIYVKKVLEPNPFLMPDFVTPEPFKAESFLQAELVFSKTPDRTDRPSWGTKRNSCAVLSSGGKDSLLTYGLVSELGCDVHPVFINESGRHWFTALNAYRHFRDHVPNAARVWTNSDRVFAWMLRRLPFIRKDFAQMRSDEYPVRLWTVAVFLFGALPLIRNREIGRLLIGNEFDTTRRTVFKGVPNYCGLYDQSRYFDTVLTRYFQRKGWGVCQFSILRPLSELLIEKILVERYPELQRHQVSCHAAHKEDGRIRPCGRCEKCRRIVGMIKALGHDPSRCGYRPEQIDLALKDLGEKGVHQISSDARHLSYLLERKGILQAGEKGATKPCSEVMKLRFDNERSPIDCIPMDLRLPLFDIYLSHAEGAVKRSGNRWIDFRLREDPDLNRPYRFERTGTGKGSSALSGQEEDDFLLATMTWPRAAQKLREVDLALLPVGAVEQHGPHLPLDTDAFDAEYLAREVARSCRPPKPFVLPLIPYGVSYHHADFSGTFSISPETLSRIVYELGMEAARQGITKLVIINGHGGNSPALHFAAQMINRDARIFTCVDTGESSDTDLNAIAETPNDVHAGEIETSTTLAIRPEQVKIDLAEKFIPNFSIRYLNFSSKRSVGWYTHTARISQSGILGDPTCANAEKGRKMWQLMINNLVEFVEDLKDMSLDEIYQKRY